MRFFRNILYGTLLFGIYLELSPGLGNIWYRIGADGARHFSPKSLLSIIVNPLISSDLWQPSLWDVNYLIFISIWLLVRKLQD
jgi:hypothetical protein